MGFLTSTVTVSTLVQDVTTFVSSAIEWIGDFADTVTGNPLLVLACVAVPLSGFGIGALSRLIRGTNA